MLRSKRSATRHLPSAATGSWIALVAATTLGDAAETVRAEIRADRPLDGTYRLVVQSYESNVSAKPGRYERPIGSAQRAVTADELRDGVHISLVSFRDPLVSGGGAPTVFAWIEDGQPDLEFDGRMARPRPGSVYGLGKCALGGGDMVQISLDRTLGS
jgi:hypothetical protein